MKDDRLGEAEPQNPADQTIETAEAVSSAESLPSAGAVRAAETIERHFNTRIDLAKVTYLAGIIARESGLPELQQQLVEEKHNADIYQNAIYGKDGWQDITRAQTKGLVELRAVLKKIEGYAQLGIDNLRAADKDASDFIRIQEAVRRVLGSEREMDTTNLDSTDIPVPVCPNCGVLHNSEFEQKGEPALCICKRCGSEIDWE